MKKLFTSWIESMKSGLYASSLVTLDPSTSPKFSALFSTDTTLVEYLNTLFRFAISIGAILAVIRLGYAGYLYMGSDMWGNKKEARDMIRDVFIGLFLLLGVYIILAQINPQLLNLKINIDRLPPVAGAPSGTTSGTSGGRDINEITSNEDRVRSVFSQAGIGINRSACTSVGQRACTSVGGLPSSAINGLLNIKRDSRCPITITGGTEWWLHSGGTKHGPGGSVVDLGRDTCLDNYLRSGGNTCTTTTTFIRGRSILKCSPQVGGTYYQEDSAHWHVEY